MKKIEEAFADEGYVSVPFSFNGAGHPLIEVILANNVHANFLLDTGSSINLLDYEFAKELGLNLVPTGEQGGGAGGLVYDIFSVGGISIEVSGQHIRFDSFYSMDFSSIKEILTSKEIREEIHGILGVGFFKMTKCFIDYASNRIFILNHLATS